MHGNTNNSVQSLTASPLSDWFNFCLNITIFADFYSTVPLPFSTLSVSFFLCSSVIHCHSDTLGIFPHIEMCCRLFSCMIVFLRIINIVNTQTNKENFFVLLHGMFFAYFSSSFFFVGWDWRKCHLICEIWETCRVFNTFNAPFQIDLNNAFSKFVQNVFFCSLWSNDSENFQNIFDTGTIYLISKM